MKTHLLAILSATLALLHQTQAATPSYGTNQTTGAAYLLPGRTQPSPAPPTVTTNIPPAPATNIVVSPPGTSTNFQVFLAKTVQTNIITGESILVSWKNPPFPFALTFFDWVGLYAVGASDSQFIERRFVIGLEQEVSFTPPKPGTYEIRYIRWNGERVATFGPIVVNAVPPFSVSIERTGRFVSHVSWPTRIGKTYVLYVSLDLKDWEPVVVITGTGGLVVQPVVASGFASFRALER